MSQTPDISIITVNYNGFSETCHLIRSLQDHISQSYELIVIDNASQQDEAALLRQRYPQIRAIRSEKNLGFAGGNNLGIREARGKYILLLNNDTYVTDDSLHFLCEALERKPGIGAVSPKIKFASAPQMIQFAGYTPLSGITLRNRMIGSNEEDRGQYNVPTPTPYLHGAAMMIKREVISKAGPMPEIYFLYYEELDWCTQMTDLGYELWYEPRCTVFHKESYTTGVGSPLKIFYLSRNRLLYAWRHRQGIEMITSMLYQWGIAMPKNMITFLLQGKTEQAKAVIRGCTAFFRIKNKRK